MSINARELRIGNLFIDKYSKKLIPVLELLRSGRIVFDFECYGKWQAEPIPLTEEWLVRMGFEQDYKSHIHSVFVIGNGNFSYYFWYNDKRQYLNISGTNFVCNYVHSLQNLYFSLTGEELTIKE